jgi:hypothetical protein
MKKVFCIHCKYYKKEKFYNFRFDEDDISYIEVCASKKNYKFNYLGKKTTNGYPEDLNKNCDCKFYNRIGK